MLWLYRTRGRHPVACGNPPALPCLRDRFSAVLCYTQGTAGGLSFHALPPLQSNNSALPMGPAGHVPHQSMTAQSQGQQIQAQQVGTVQQGGIGASAAPGVCLCVPQSGSNLQQQHKHVQALSKHSAYSKQRSMACFERSGHDAGSTGCPCLRRSCVTAHPRSRGNYTSD